ncbi:LUD domain-containing protein [Chloroflexota bacterium]
MVNRLAGVIFGPKKVILVAGANKIVKDIDEAMERIKYVAPINVRRHYIKHGFTELEKLPCFKTGYCVDCMHPEHICSYIVIIRGQRAPLGATDYLPRISIIIVGEELGI